MASVTKVPLSGSTDYKGIKIAATASAGTTLHTADATAEDELWIGFYNSSVVPVLITVQWGGTTAVDNDIKETIPPLSGIFTVIRGIPIQNGLVVRAYADTTNVVVAYGYCNRIVN